MQVADNRMIASVGSMILGSSRSSTRTSPGPYITTPRIVRAPSGLWFGGWLADPGGRLPVESTRRVGDRGVPVDGCTDRAPLGPRPQVPTDLLFGRGQPSGSA